MPVSKEPGSPFSSQVSTLVLVRPRNFSVTQTGNTEHGFKQKKKSEFCTVICLLKGILFIYMQIFINEEKFVGRFEGVFWSENL